VSHYILPGAPRELNLGYRERYALLHALSFTTHPSAFDEVFRLTATTLRHHSHRNFIRWSICNGNKPRVFVLRSLAVFVLSISVALGLVLVLSPYTRWVRIALFPAFYFGVVNLIAARQGLCVLLHRRRTREARPWEIHDDGEKTPVAQEAQDEQDHRTSRRSGTRSLASSRFASMISSPSSPVEGYFEMLSSAKDIEAALERPSHTMTNGLTPTAGTESTASSRPASVKEKLAAFGPRNTFGHEPWVTKWKRRSPWQKIRVQKIRLVQGTGLRTVQDRILWQAELWGLLITIVIIAVFTALPVVGAF